MAGFRLITLLKNSFIAGVFACGWPLIAQEQPDDVPTPRNLYLEDLSSIVDLQQSLGVNGLSLIDGGIRDNTTIGSDVLSMLDVLCRVLTLGKATTTADNKCETAVFPGLDLKAVLIGQRETLSTIVDESAQAYVLAQADIISDMAGVANNGGVGNVDLDAWWNESGLRALLALDRVGREYIRLNERTGDRLEENAKAHVLTRLTDLLRREDVAIVVSVLVNKDNDRFGALMQVSTQPDDALTATANLSQWLADAIADNIKAALQSGAVSGDATRSFLEHLIEREGRLSLDGLVAELEALRQDFESLIVMAEGIVEGQCSLSGLGATRLTGIGPRALARGSDPERQTLEDERMNSAAASLMGLIENCNAAGAEGVSVISELFDAVGKTTQGNVDPVLIAQSFCSLYEGLGESSQDIAAHIFPSDFQAAVPPVQFTEEICAVIRRLPIEIEQSEQWLTTILNDENDGELRTAVQALLDVIKTNATTIIENLEDISPEIWAAQVLVQGQTFANLGNKGIVQGCYRDPLEEGPILPSLGLTFSIGTPVVEKVGDDLIFVSSALVQLCPISAPINQRQEGQISTVREFAKAEGEIRVDLSEFAQTMAQDGIDDSEGVLQSMLDEAVKGISFSFSDPQDITQEAAHTLFQMAFAGLPSGGGALLNRLATDELEQDIAIDIALSEDGKSVKFSRIIAVLGNDINICIFYPMGNEFVAPDNCVDATADISALADTAIAQLRETLILTALQKLRSNFGQNFPDLTTWLEEVATLSIGNDGYGLRVNFGDTENGQLPEGMRDISIDGAGLVILDDFRGVFHVTMPSDGGQVDIVQWPMPDVSRIVSRHLSGLSENGFLVVGIAEQDADRCVSLRLAGNAPLQGPLGGLCLAEDLKKLAYVVPERGFLMSIPGFGVDVIVVAEKGASDGIINLEIGLQSTDMAQLPAALRGIDSLFINANLNDGDFALLEADNRDLYLAINNEIATRLPAEISLKAVSLSSEGIELEMAPEGRDLPQLLLTGLYNSDIVTAFLDGFEFKGLDGCEATRAAAVFTMFRDMEVSTDSRDLLRISCSDSGQNERELFGVNRTTSLELSDGVSLLQWKCIGNALNVVTGAPIPLRSCWLKFPAIGEICDRITLRLEGGGDAQTRRLEGLDACIASLAEPLVPAYMQETDLRDLLTGLPEDINIECDEQGPFDIHSCSISTNLRLDLPDINAPGGEACNIGLPESVDLLARIRMNGTVDLETDLEQAFRDWGETYLSCQAKRGLQAILGQSAREFFASDYPGYTCNVAYQIDTQPRFIPCDQFTEIAAGPGLDGADGIKLSKTNIEIYGSNFTANVYLPFSAGGASPLGTPVYSITCQGCEDRLNELADSIAGNVARISPFITYEGGATLGLNGSLIMFRSPMVLKLDVLGTQAAFVTNCQIDILDKDSNSCGADIDVTQLANQLLEVLAGQQRTYSLGLFSVDIGPPALSPDGKGIILAGAMTLPDFDIRSLGNISIHIPLTGGDIDVTVAADLGSTVGEQLKDQINALIGVGAVITVTNIDITPDNHGLPQRIRISSAVQISDLFKISVPDVVLSESGLDVVGLNELTISFPAGFQIPATPFTICPTGGTLGEERLVIYTTVTLGECTVAHLVNIRGSAEIGFGGEKAGLIALRGDLIIFGFLPLGSADAVLRMNVPSFESDLDLGGVLSDVISFKSHMDIQGNHPPSADMESELALFRVPLSTQRVRISFDKDNGGIDAFMDFNLFDFLRATGTFSSDISLRTPEATFNGNANVGGWTLGGINAFARPDRLRARFEVLGMKMTVVLPGFDVFTPDFLAKLIENMLTPNFKNLDKALLAILSGDITINPLADFGGGGDGFSSDGDDDEQEDGDEGESPDPVAEENAEIADAGSAAEAVALNPPGRFGVVFMPADAPTDVVLQENGEDVALLARIPRGTELHNLVTPILTGSGQRLALSRRSYIHVWRSIFRSDDVIGNCEKDAQNETVFTFTGGEDPLVGYAELCRFGAGIESKLGPDWGDVTIPFFDALAQTPATFEPLLDIETENSEEPQRQAQQLLQVGRISNIGDARFALALLSPGRALITADLLQGVEDGRCTETGENTTLRQVKTFVIQDSNLDMTSFDTWINDRLPSLLAALTACDSAHIFLSEYEENGTNQNWLSAQGTLSRLSQGRYVLVRERPEAQQSPEVPESLMISAATDRTSQIVPLDDDIPAPITPEELREAATPSPDGSAPVLNGEAGGVPLVFEPNGAGRCKVSRDGAEITSYPADLFSDGCFTVGRSIVFAQEGKRFNIVELSESEGGSARLIHLRDGDGWDVDIGTDATSVQTMLVMDALMGASIRQEDGVGYGALATGLVSVGFDNPEAGGVALILKNDSNATMAWAVGRAVGMTDIPKRITDEPLMHVGLPRLLATLEADPSLGGFTDGGRISGLVNSLKLYADSIDVFWMNSSYETKDMVIPLIVFSEGRWEHRLSWRTDQEIENSGLDVVKSKILTGAMEPGPTRAVWSFALPDGGIALAQNGKDLSVWVSTVVSARRGMPEGFDYGTDSNRNPDWNGDEYCDDIRFSGAKVYFQAFQTGTDATDCRSFYDAGSIELKDEFLVDLDTARVDVETFTFDIAGIMSLAQNSRCRSIGRDIAGTLHSGNATGPLRVHLIDETCADENAVVFSSGDSAEIQNLSILKNGNLQHVVTFEGDPLLVEYVETLLQTGIVAEQPVRVTGKAYADAGWAGLVEGTQHLLLIFEENNRIRRLQIQGVSELLAEFEPLLDIAKSSDGDTFSIFRRPNGGWSMLIQNNGSALYRLINLPVDQVGAARMMSFSQDDFDGGPDWNASLAWLAAMLELSRDPDGNDRFAYSASGPWSEMPVTLARDRLIARPYGRVSDSPTFFIETTSPSQRWFSLCGDDVPPIFVGALLDEFGQDIAGNQAFLNECANAGAIFKLSPGNPLSALLVLGNTDNTVTIAPITCEPENVGQCEISTTTTNPIGIDSFRTGLIDRLSDLFPVTPLTTQTLRVLFDGTLGAGQDNARALMFGWREHAAPPNRQATAGYKIFFASDTCLSNPISISVLASGEGADDGTFPTLSQTARDQIAEFFFIESNNGCRRLDQIKPRFIQLGNGDFVHFLEIEAGLRDLPPVIGRPPEFRRVQLASASEAEAWRIAFGGNDNQQEADVPPQRQFSSPGRSGLEVVINGNIDEPGVDRILAFVASLNSDQIDVDRLVFEPDEGGIYQAILGPRLLGAVRVSSQNSWIILDFGRDTPKKLQNLAAVLDDTKTGSTLMIGGNNTDGWVFLDENRDVYQLQDPLNKLGTIQQVDEEYPDEIRAVLDLIAEHGEPFVYCFRDTDIWVTFNTGAQCDTGNDLILWNVRIGDGWSNILTNLQPEPKLLPAIGLGEGEVRFIFRAETGVVTTTTASLDETDLGIALSGLNSLGIDDGGISFSLLINVDQNAGIMAVDLAAISQMVTSERGQKLTVREGGLLLKYSGADDSIVGLATGGIAYRLIGDDTSNLTEFDIFLNANACTDWQPTQPVNDVLLFKTGQVNAALFNGKLVWADNQQINCHRFDESELDYVKYRDQLVQIAAFEVNLAGGDRCTGFGLNRDSNIVYCHVLDNSFHAVKPDVAGVVQVAFLPATPALPDSLWRVVARLSPPAMNPHSLIIREATVNTAHAFWMVENRIEAIVVVESENSINNLVITDEMPLKGDIVRISEALKQYGMLGADPVSLTKDGAMWLCRGGDQGGLALVKNTELSAGLIPLVTPENQTVDCANLTESAREILRYLDRTDSVADVKIVVRGIGALYIKDAFYYNLAQNTECKTDLHGAAATQMFNIAFQTDAVCGASREIDGIAIAEQVGRNPVISCGDQIFELISTRLNPVDLDLAAAAFNALYLDGSCENTIDRQVSWWQGTNLLLWIDSRLSIAGPDMGNPHAFTTTGMLTEHNGAAIDKWVSIIAMNRDEIDTIMLGDDVAELNFPDDRKIVLGESYCYAGINLGRLDLRDRTFDSCNLVFANVTVERHNYLFEVEPNFSFMDEKIRFRCIEDARCITATRLYDKNGSVDFGPDVDATTLWRVYMSAIGNDAHATDFLRALKFRGAGSQYWLATLAYLHIKDEETYTNILNGTCRQFDNRHPALNIFQSNDPDRTVQLFQPLRASIGNRPPDALWFTGFASRNPLLILLSIGGDC